MTHRTTPRRRRAVGLALACFGWFFGLPSWAAAPIDSLRISPDTTIDDGASGVVADEGFVLEVLTGPVGLMSDPALPAGVDLDALTLRGNETIFSVDTTVQLGSIVARPGDLVSFDGSTYAIDFDASAEGIQGNIDAASADHGDMLVSFDTTVLVGGSLVIHDEDILRIDGTTFSLHLDGAAAGIDPSLDIDAVHRFVGGDLLVSFDTSGTVGGVTFDDEDLLEYRSDTSTWEMAYDASASAVSVWTGADLDAVWAYQARFGGGICGLGPELAFILLPLLVASRSRTRRSTG